MSYVQELRDLAVDFEQIDRAVYDKYDRDPLEPIIGLGDRRARIGFFGRDPGRQEVEHAMPFVGAAGQKIRKELHQALHGEPMPDFDASLAVGAYAFWANTVPYKPIGNKVWPMKIRRAVRPVLAKVLVEEWDGRDVVTMGNEALHWWGLDDRDTKKRLLEHMKTEDRYETSIEVDLLGETFRLHPLPHPSPLNKAWYGKFQGLLAGRLAALGFSKDTWTL